MKRHLGLLLVLPFIAEASSQNEIEISLQTPLQQETEAGTVVTATFLLTNTTPNKESFLSSLELPPGWISIPFEEPFFYLEATETTVQWVAFRVPPNALAGSYPVRYVVQGRDHPSLYTESNFSIQVLGKNILSTHIEKPPSYIIEGNSYETAITVTNEGNLRTDVQITIKEHQNFPLLVEDPLTFSLQPKESKQIRVEVKTPKNLEDSTKHFLHISVENPKDPSSIQYFSTEVEIFLLKKSKMARYHTLPMETTIGYGQKNSKIEAFIEQKGKGALDEKKNIDFFFRAPCIKQANIDRDLGGLPENGYLHFWDPFIDLYGGDGLYTLTPLTLLNRFGTGGSFTLNPAPVTLKTLYIKDTSSIPRSILGGSLSYEPLPLLSFSLSSEHTHFTKKSERILENESNAFTHSILGEFENKKFGTLQAEYADTGNLFSREKHHQSYYLYSRGNTPYKIWYALQKIYAGSDFVGYYQDTDQSYVSLGFPIIKKLQGTLSYNRTAYNLQKNHNKDSAPRNQNAYGGLSYSFPFGLYTSCYYNYLQLKDSFSHLGYQTHFVSLNGGQSIKEWTFQGILEYGHYSKLTDHSLSHLWQNYQLYTYYQPTPKRQYAVYAKMGYTELSKTITWSRIYGVSSAWATGKHLKLQLMYQFSDQDLSKQYLNSNIQYTFHNKSYMQLKGYWNKSTKESSTLEFLLSYTIPWSLPLRKNKSIGHIQGTISQKNGKEIDTPLPQLVVNCNGMRTLTDDKGNFTFPDLTPGDYHLWLEGNTKNRVSTTSLPLSIPLNGGELVKKKISFESPCTITGIIPLYSFEEDTLKKEGYASSATLILRSATTQEKIITTTDAKGHFSFNDLPSGRWLLEVYSSTIPPYHYFEPKELLIDLFPGTTHTPDIKLLPLKRQLRMIDDGTIHSR